MIKKYTKKDGTTAYKLSAYLGVDPMTGKQVRTTRQGFKTIKEAKRAEVKLVEDFQRQGAWKNNDRTTFDEVAKMWFEQYKTTVRESTYATTYHYYASKIDPAIGNQTINKISVMTCQKLINKLSQFAPYSSYISIMNRIFKFAMHISIIDTNPLDRTIRAKCSHVPKSDTKINYYTKPELNLFLEKAKEIYGIDMVLFFRILAYGGLRNGEALVLEESDFDFKNNTISISKTYARNQKGATTNKPKTKKSKRVISMDTETMRLAKEYISKSIKPLHGSFRLFTVTPVAITYRTKKVAKKAGIRVISPHGFRHTHASILFEAGIEPKIIQERLGHAKISMTLDLYTHLNKKQTDNVADQFAEFMVS